MYSPPTGAENAAPGQVIASATWNTIHTDIAAALTLVGEQSWAQTPRVVSSGNFTVNTTDSVIFVEGSSPTITVPLAATKPYPVKILGAASGIFSTTNSTIVPTSPDTFSGNTAVVMTADYQELNLYPLASGGYIVDILPATAPSTLRVTLKGINFNSANTDNAIPIPLPPGFTRYMVTQIQVTDATTSLTSATCGVFTSAGGTGTVIVTSPTTLTVSSAAINVNNNTQSLTINNMNSMLYNFNPIYFRVVGAEGGTATANVSVSFAPYP